MKNEVFVRVVATPINFPDDLEMTYHVLDNEGEPTGESLGGMHFSWQHVKCEFMVPQTYVAECENYFSQGLAVFIGNRHLALKVDD